MKKTEVTVVIVSYKSALLTVESLRSISHERTLTDSIYIRAIVVDNDSGDYSTVNEHVINNGWESWVTVIAAPINGGFAYGNNLAFAHAYAHWDVDYFHMLNPDAQLLPNALIALVSFLEQHRDVGIAGSSFNNEDGSLWPIAFRFPTVYSEIESGIQLGLITKLLKKWVVPVTMTQQNQAIDWIAGASMMIRSNVIKDTGGFDENYFLYYEETDFCLRANRLGHSTWYVPESRVVHIAGQSTKVTERNAKPKRLPAYWFESRRRYYLTNHGLLYAMWVDLAFTVAYSIGLVKRALLGRLDEITPHFLYDMLSHSPLLLRGTKNPRFKSRLSQNQT